MPTDLATRGGNINTAQETLKALLQDGLSEVELMDGPIRSYAGIRDGGGRGRQGGPQETPPKPTDAERDGQLAKCRELRKMYNDAGVTIHLQTTRPNTPNWHSGWCCLTPS